MSVRTLKQFGWLCAIAVLVFAIDLGRASSDESDVVRVWSRSDYFPPELLEEFQRKTGITVDHEVYRARGGSARNIFFGTSNYDLILPPVSLLGQLIELERVQRIDFGKVTTTHNLGAGVLRFMANYRKDRERPLRLYGVPLLFGFTGIGYNAGEASIRTQGNALDSLKDIFDPQALRRFSDCGIALVEAPAEVVRSALLYLGEDPTSNDPQIIAKAEAVLMAIRPHVSEIYTDDLMQDLAEGRVCLAFGWSGDVLRAHVAARAAEPQHEIGFVLPKEGSPVWIDAMSIPINASNPNNAYAFINFLLEPTVAAKIARHALYPTVNVGANAIGWEEGLFENRQIFPKWEIIDHQFMAPANDAAALAQIGEMWARFEAAGE